MNLALWLKPVREGYRLLLGSALFLVLFHYINVWIVAQIKANEAMRLLAFLSRSNSLVKDLLTVPPDVLASPAGRIALGFDHPLTFATIIVWAVARGSDSVSGEIGRGTMEVLLAQPVRRINVLLASFVTTTLGLAVLALACWCGVYLGIARVKLETPVSPHLFWPATLNLFCLGFLMAGVTTLASSCDRYRPRTIGFAVGFFFLEAVIRFAGLFQNQWLKYFTFLTAFDPQVLTWRFRTDVLPKIFGIQVIGKIPDDAWRLLWETTAVLGGIGLAGYVLAAIIFCRRDLPAPL